MSFNTPWQSGRKGDPLNTLPNPLWWVINIGKMHFVHLAPDTAPKEVVCYCKIRQLGRPDDVPEVRTECAWKCCPKNLHGNLCCVSSCSKHHCARWQSVWKRRLAGKLFFKFLIWSHVSGAHGACLILQHHNTASGATSKESHTKCILPILMP